jgi:hypothetical protein
MAPADGFFAKPVKGVFAHSGIEAWSAEVGHEEKRDRNRNKRKHRGYYDDGSFFPAYLKN